MVSSLGFGRFSYALLLPAMRADFNTSYTQMGSIATANALAYMISALVCGILTGRFGARVVITCALILCAIGVVCTGLAQSVEQAAIFQFLCGLGTGGAVGPVYAITNPWFAPHKRGLATGIVQMGSGLGLLVGGFLVPQLQNAGGESGWRYAWYALGLLIFVVSFLAAILLRNNPVAQGLSPFGSKNQPSKVAHPTHARSSQLANLKSVYTSIRIWHLGIIFSCFGLSYVVYTVYFAAYLVSNGLSNQEAGFIWSAGGFVSVGGSLLWGIVADRRGSRFSLMAVLSIQATALLILSLFNNTLGYYLGAMLYGLALWGIPVVISYTTALVAGPKMTAPALGMVIVCFSVGQVIGPLLAGWLKDVSGSLVIPLIVASCIAWVGVLLSTMVKIPRYS